MCLQLCTCWSCSQNEQQLSLQKELPEAQTRAGPTMQVCLTQKWMWLVCCCLKETMDAMRQSSWKPSWKKKPSCAPAVTACQGVSHRGLGGHVKHHGQNQGPALAALCHVAGWSQLCHNLMRHILWQTSPVCLLQEQKRLIGAVIRLPSCSSPNTTLWLPCAGPAEHAQQCWGRATPGAGSPEGAQPPGGCPAD